MGRGQPQAREQQPQNKQQEQYVAEREDRGQDAAQAADFDGVRLDDERPEERTERERPDRGLEAGHAERAELPYEVDRSACDREVRRDEEKVAEAERRRRRVDIDDRKDR